MILVWLLVITAAGGTAAWLVDYRSHKLCRWVALVALFVDALLLVAVWSSPPIPGGRWFAQVDYPWIASLGISFHLAADGLSLLLLSLTVVVGIIAVGASWTEIDRRIGAFHASVMLTLAAIMGIFMAMDLFLFYFLWELMLVPMYFLLGIWGGQQRVQASFRFFLFTQAGGLLMLVAILALYFIHGHNTGTYTFDYQQLIGASGSGASAFWLMLGFFAAFAVKLPVVGLHPWLPGAYTEAPTAGSIILAGLMSKTGAYGFLRFVLPLFPQASAELAPVAMILGIAGIWYGAILAFGQTNVKRLVAYASLGHLGYVLLGIYAGNRLALQGVILILLAHGLSVAGLFFVTGILRARLRTLDLGALGGLWSSAPRLGGVTVFLALASMGLPGLGNFVGEFLVLTGTFAVSPALASVAAAGFILSVIYAVWLVYRVFQGPESEACRMPDIGVRELAIFGLIVAGILWLGLYPQPVLNAFEPQAESLIVTAAMGKEDSGALISERVSRETTQATERVSFGGAHDGR